MTMTKSADRKPSRREILGIGAAVVAATALPTTAEAKQASASMMRLGSSTITTKDGAQIYYKDWGSGQPIVFSHGWPLTADDWDGQMLFFGMRGYRVIAHDRRGHGRSTQTWDGNEMDTYADDLATLTEKLDLKQGMARCASPRRCSSARCRR
jgi:non-heme chloroperoxidase